MVSKLPDLPQLHQVLQSPEAIFFSLPEQLQDSTGNCVGKDSSTLGGFTSSQFLRSDTSDNYTSGTLTFDSGTTLQLSNVSASTLLATDNLGNVVSSTTPYVASINATSTTATSTFAGGLS